MTDNPVPDLTYQQVSYGFARQHGVMAMETADGLCLARREDADLSAILEARRIVARPVPVLALARLEFDRALTQVFAQNDLSSSAEDALDMPEDLTALAQDLPRSADVLDSADDAPVIRLINGILQEAIRTKASDIHIEPHEERLLVRFSIDGALREMLSLSPRLASVLVSRVKVMAQLDIAKKRIPQDGRFSLNLGPRSVDVRVSTLPSRYGERAVMRLLEKDKGLMEISDLGMPEDTLSALKAALDRPNGIVLVTGPTGSGKTTTLYAGLTRLNDGSRNIMTIEDPIEYALDGISQTQVNSSIGMSFAAGLRAILRQAPHIIMVGEIRDTETAEVAMQSSMTGHLVLSTVHTNSAIAAISRLRDMGIEPFLLASTVTAIMAQRLVRRLCPHCKTPYAPSAAELAKIGIRQKSGLTFYKPKGCGECNHIGYDGRLGVYEIVIMDDTLRAMIHQGRQDAEMSKHAFKARKSLLQSGAAHVLAGHTSAEEVLRVCAARNTENIQATGQS